MDSVAKIDFVFLSYKFIDTFSYPNWIYTFLIRFVTSKKVGNCIVAIDNKDENSFSDHKNRYVIKRERQRNKR